MDKVLAGAAILLAAFGIVELVAMAYGGRISATQEYKQIIALDLGGMVAGTVYQLVQWVYIHFQIVYKS